MKLQTVLLILALVAVAIFLLRRARNSVAGEYRKRFDSTLPQQDSSYQYVPVPLMTGGEADGVSHHVHGTDCAVGSTDAGTGCSDGGGSH